MSIPILAFCIAAILPTTSHADMLPGADDPYFIAAMTLALGADDTLALHDLHALASAGNIAALVALPTVERWMPRAGGSLAERTALRKINGTPIADLANTASPIARLWLQGAASDDMAIQMDRAVGLYALGEVTKGDTLLATWFNYTGGFPPLPAGFADLPASAWLKAAIIETRLNPFIGNPSPDPEGDMAILNAWLADDRLEGWIVLARVTGRAVGRALSAEETVHGDTILATALARTPPDLARQSDARIIAAALVWNATFRHASDTPLANADVQTIWQEMSPRPEFNPVVLYCTAQCPADPPACERAHIQAFGLQNGNASWFEPQSDAVSPATFYASPRAERLLITNGLRMPPDAQGDIAAVMATLSLAAAVQTDACFAAAVTRVLTTALPSAP